MSAKAENEEEKEKKIGVTVHVSYVFFSLNFVLHFSLACLDRFLLGTLLGALSPGASQVLCLLGTHGRCLLQLPRFTFFDRSRRLVSIGSYLMVRIKICYRRHACFVSQPRQQRLPSHRGALPSWVSRPLCSIVNMCRGEKE